MISVPKGALRLAALRLLSESSLSGDGLTKSISRLSAGEWAPGPGSVYLILSELLKKGLITELPKREGNERRYIISSKGKAELARLSKEAGRDVERLVRLLEVYASLSGDGELERRVRGASQTFLGGPTAGKA
ncbi:MAG: PadR family transcriptional regulator [archaeon]|nr:MAG: PadR family transcriptional regulator [archaeon]